MSIMFISISLCACSQPGGIYIDIKENAIISCDGIGFKEIRIENESETIMLEGTQSTIYFNKKNNVFRTSLYGDILNDYVLKLKPNSRYVVTKYNGYDRGPINVTIQTDMIGRVIKASVEKCE